ncbi:hypothetical protein TNCV_1816601 [Trichonephila clavipes]|nr:hypothetical protein TNCV_1816601 [Trichonephila clavipes]
MYYCAGCFDQSEAKSRRQQRVRLQDFWAMRCGIKKERNRILRRRFPRFAEINVGNHWATKRQPCPTPVISTTPFWS